MARPKSQLDREIAAALTQKRPFRGKLAAEASLKKDPKRLSLGRQRLIFIKFEPADTFSGVRAVPVPVDFREAQVAKVWTLYNETDRNKPPALPFSPIHHRNAFAEDRIHDWNIVAGKFRYGSRVMDRDVWVLVELKP